MIYNFHHFDYWIRGGLEYGQAYRAKILRNLGLDAKFIFATEFPTNNIQHETSNMGFLDDEVLWLYGFFTNCRLSPTTYTLEQLERTFKDENYIFSRTNLIVKYDFPNKNKYYIVYLSDDTENYVHRVEIISDSCLLRKDYYSYCCIYSEYFAPLNGYAHLYLRRFFNDDGTTAYEEVIDNDVYLYKFPDRILFSKDELVGYMLSCLNFTEDDTILIDSSLGSIDPAVVVQNASRAKVGFIIHENHFVEGDTDEEHILWYHHYEYIFSHLEQISFFVTSTDVQRDLLKKQFVKYEEKTPTIVTIPVGGLDKIRISDETRKKHSLITASRLASEKNIDLLIDAVVEARKQIPDLSLDIYGNGYKETELKEQIKKRKCDNYVSLCGHQKLDEVYQRYEAYVSASTGETFGITLMEAIGAGLPIIGFDVRYGNQVFIDDGKNGYRIPWKYSRHREEYVHDLAEGIVKLFMETNLEIFRECSYKKARSFLTGEIEERWKKILNQTE